MPSIVFYLMLVVTLVGGKVEQTELAGPFTNLSACAIMGGILYRQGGFEVTISKDAQKAYMTCLRRFKG